jgi:hypothetical protein
MSVMHHVPGRLRVRLAEVKGNPGKARNVVQQFTAMPGVASVESSTLTGSVVIYYDPNAADVNALLAGVGFEAGCPVAVRRRSSLQDQIAQRAAAAVLNVLIEKAIVRLVVAIL